MYIYHCRCYVYYKERKIEKKKKYIAVKKKKKKNSAVCSSIVKRTKTLIFWNSNASLILKNVECVFKKKCTAKL